MSAPSGQAPEHDGITDTRTKVVTKRQLAGRIVALLTSAGLEPEAWQVRQLLKALAAVAVEPTDEQVLITLMKAPWFPKPRHRQWQVGEGGGWATRS